MKRLATGFGFLVLMTCAMQPSFAGLDRIVLTEGGNPEAGVTVRSSTNDPMLRDRKVRITISGVNYAYDIVQTLDKQLEVSPGKEVGPSAVEFKTVLITKPQGGILFFEGGEVYVSTARPKVYQSPDAVSPADHVVFDVEYRLKDKNVVNAGKASTYLRFILLPRGSSGTGPMEESQTILFKVETDTLKESVEVETSDHNENSVSLSTSADDRKKGFVDFTIPQSPNKTYQLYLTPVVAPTDPQAAVFGDLMMRVTTNKGQSKVMDWKAADYVEQNQLLFETNREISEAETEVQLMLKDGSDPRAGMYAGQFRFELRVDGAVEATFPVNVRIEVKPVFDISVVGSPQLSFANVKENADPIEKDVVLHVTSNRGRPYSVVQHYKAFVNPKTGKEGLSEFYVEGKCAQEDAGTVVVATKTKMKDGDMAVFDSGPEGKSADVSLHYAVTGSRNDVGGEYTADLRYSIVEK